MIFFVGILNQWAITFKKLSNASTKINAIIEPSCLCSVNDFYKQATGSQFQLMLLIWLILAKRELYLHKHIVKHEMVRYLCRFSLKDAVQLLCSCLYSKTECFWLGLDRIRCFTLTLCLDNFPLGNNLFTFKEIHSLRPFRKIISFTSTFIRRAKDKNWVIIQRWNTPVYLSRHAALIL